MSQRSSGQTPDKRPPQPQAPELPCDARVIPAGIRPGMHFGAGRFASPAEGRLESRALSPWLRRASRLSEETEGFSCETENANGSEQDLTAFTQLPDALKERNRP